MAEIAHVFHDAYNLSPFSLFVLKQTVIIKSTIALVHITGLQLCHGFYMWYLKVLTFYTEKTRRRWNYEKDYVC